MALSACGFQPLYATHTLDGTVSATLSRVQVEPTSDEYSRAVAFALEDRMLSEGVRDPLYRVELSSLISIGDVAVEQNTDVTRKNVVLTTNYALYQIDNGELVLKRRARAINAYNRVESEFANIVAERDAIERASRQIATTIEQDLAVFFNRQGE